MAVVRFYNIETIGFAALLAALVTASAGEPAPDREPFNVGGAEIEWKAPTNSLRGHFWIYKSAPQTCISGAVISNAIAIGSFEPRHLVNPHDKKVLQFQDKPRSHTRGLRIDPAAGSITYGDSLAIARMTEPVEGVPDEREVRELALDYLFKLGIDKRELSLEDSHPWKQERGHYSRDGKEEGVIVEGRGIIFPRQIDGTLFYGYLSKFSVHFGNHAKVASLNLIWPNFVPHEIRETASPRQIVEWIKSGKSFLPMPYNLTGAKKLIIEGLMPYYNLTIPSPDGHQFAYPIALLGVSTVLDNQQQNFALLCPLVAGTSVNPPQCK